MSYIISILTGVILSVMISFNGNLSTVTGNYVSSVIIHAVGLVGIIIVLLVTKSKVKNLKGIPFYLFTGGFIVILTVLFNNLRFANLGVSLIVSLCVLVQFVTSIIIDHFG